jgi:hypothetical protein
MSGADSSVNALEVGDRMMGRDEFLALASGDDLGSRLLRELLAAQVNLGRLSTDNAEIRGVVASAQGLLRDKASDGRFSPVVLEQEGDRIRQLTSRLSSFNNNDGRPECSDPPDTPTGTSTVTKTVTVIKTETETVTKTVTLTEIQTGTKTETVTKTVTLTEIQTGTKTETVTKTETATSTVTEIETGTKTVTVTQTATGTETKTEIGKDPF